MRLYTRFSFHPIGQGTFASGALSSRSPDHIDLRWVYDCGTVKRWIPQLGQEIDRFARHCVNLSDFDLPKQSLEVVFVSHFDFDHISGLVRLLQTFEVKTIVLPYIPLWQRVVRSIQSKYSGDAQSQAFLMNPVAFITSLEGVNIRRILLVPPSTGAARGGDSDLDGAAGPLNPQRPPPEASPTVRIDGEQKLGPPDSNPAETVAAQRSNGQTAVVSWLAPGGRIIGIGGWEFVPYNDPKYGPKATPNFRLKVKNLAHKLLTGSPSTRAAALASLKSSYTAQFGTSARRKNIISLFVYGGPTLPFQQRHVGVAQYPSLATEPESGNQCWSGQCFHCSNPIGADLLRPSILYTGDGYLKTPKQLHKLTKFLGSKRVQQISTLQVMHHGSRENCDEKVVEAFLPESSIFCADRSFHLRHPHDDVWKLFEDAGRILVDSRVGCTLFQELRS